MDIHAYIQSGVVESYVLGLADEEEVVEVEQLRSQYPELEQAIDDFAIALEKEAFENAIMPPVFVKQRLLAELDLNDSIAPTVPVSLVVAHKNTTGNGETNTTVPQKNNYQWLAAASIILLVISAAANYYLYNQYSATSNKYTALLNERNSLQASNQVIQAKINDYKLATDMMANPAIVTVQMKDPAGKQNNMTTVFWNKGTKDVYLLTNKLPEPAADKQYQLWALVNGAPVDAGVLDPSCTSLCKMKNIGEAQAFAITLEKQGGSPTPTLEQLYVLGKI